jgi:hypothetical protein
MFVPSPSGFPASLTRGTFAAVRVLEVYAEAGASRPSGLFARRNVHSEKQILHLRVLLCAASPHCGGIRRLARLVHRHKHDTSEGGTLNGKEYIGHWHL